MRKILLIFVLFFIGCDQENKEIFQVYPVYKTARIVNTNGYVGPWYQKEVTRIVFKDRGHIDLPIDQIDWWKPNDKVILHNQSYIELIK